MDDKDFLEHFGILGMHWGRKNGKSNVKRSKSKKTSRSTEDNISDDYKTARIMKSKGSKKLSTKELSDLTRRLQLEKQLKDFSPNDFKRGLNIVKEVTLAGTTLASLYALTKTPLGQDVKTAIQKAMSASAEAEKIKWVL